MSRAPDQPNIWPSTCSLSNLQQAVIESTGLEESMFPRSSYVQCASHMSDVHIQTKRNKLISHLLKSVCISSTPQCRLFQLAELPIRQSSRSAVGAIELWMQLLHNKKSQVLIADNSACVSDPPQNLALGLDGAREIL